MSPIAHPPQYILETQLRFNRPVLESSSQISSMRRSENRISLNVEQPAADWLRAAIRRVEDLTALAPGWDGYGAKAIDAGVALQVVSFLLDHAYRTLPEPAIVPLADGGLQIEWHHNGVDLEIAFSDDEAAVFLEDHQTGLTEERPVDEASAVFSNVMGRLTAGG